MSIGNLNNQHQILTERSSQQYSLPMRGWQYNSQYSLPTSRLQGLQGGQGLGNGCYKQGLGRGRGGGRCGGSSGGVIFGQVINERVQRQKIEKFTETKNASLEKRFSLKNSRVIVKLLVDVQNRSMLTSEVASAVESWIIGWQASKGWKCNLQI